MHSDAFYLKIVMGTASRFIISFLVLISIPDISIAIDCSRAPAGFGGSWARAYKNWCESCGGIYSSRGPTCTPGANWGVGSPYRQPSYDYEADRRRQEEEERQRIEAERRRQEEIEEQRTREEEEVRRRQQQFEMSKQNALKSMKGITEGELDLKGVDAEELTIKDFRNEAPGTLEMKNISPPDVSASPNKMNCEWGNMGSSVVDLRCLGLDPDKPVAVDPHVVKGKERAFPVQIGPETFKNINYNKGFNALKRFDAASAAQAIKYFEQARKERPNDPMVRNGLYLAQDIYKARQQKEKDDKAKASYFTLQSYACLMMGDTINARNYIQQARQLDQSENRAKFVESLAKIDWGETSTSPNRRQAYQLVSGGLVSIYKQHYAVALDMIEAAQHLQPEDRFINAFLQEMRKYESTVRERER